MKVDVSDYYRIAKMMRRMKKLGKMNWYLKSVLTLEDLSVFRLTKAIYDLDRELGHDVVNSLRHLRG